MTTALMAVNTTMNPCKVRWPRSTNPSTLRLYSYTGDKPQYIMCVFCKVLLIPNFNFLREKYGDTLFGIKYKISLVVFWINNNFYGGGGRKNGISVKKEGWNLWVTSSPLTEPLKGHVKYINIIY